MIIEVLLDGRGAVRVETEYTATPKQIKGLIDHATSALTEAQPAARPIGFGAGTDLTTEVT